MADFWSWLFADSDFLITNGKIRPFPYHLNEVKAINNSNFGWRPLKTRAAISQNKDKGQFQVRVGTNSWLGQGPFKIDVFEFCLTLILAIRFSRFLRTNIKWQPKIVSKATSEHAVHIHQYGTIENENGDVNCDGSGPHFFEADQEHGKPENTPPNR